MQFVPDRFYTSVFTCRVESRCGLSVSLLPGSRVKYLGNKHIAELIVNLFTFDGYQFYMKQSVARGLFIGECNDESNHTRERTGMEQRYGLDLSDFVAAHSHPSIR